MLKEIFLVMVDHLTWSNTIEKSHKMELTWLLYQNFKAIQMWT
jgi:hypothetical protein